MLLMVKHSTFLSSVFTICRAFNTNKEKFPPKTIKRDKGRTDNKCNVTDVTDVCRIDEHGIIKVAYVQYDGYFGS